MFWSTSKWKLLVNKNLKMLFALFVLLLPTQAIANLDGCRDGLNPQASSLRPAARAVEYIPEEAFEIIRGIQALATEVGVATENRSDFLLHRAPNGMPIVTDTVYIIKHGLLNSPAWVRWLATRLHNEGHNVLNIRLPKHARESASELNQITRRDFIRQVETTNRLGSLVGKKIIFVGHSAGGLSAELGAILSPHTDGLVLYGSANEVQNSTQRTSQIVSNIPFASIPVNMLARWRGEDRYMSAAAGVATVRFSNYIRQYSGAGFGEYGQLIETLRDLGDRVLWLDTSIDGTIKQAVNANIASLAPEINYIVLPPEAKVAHVQLANDPETIEGPGRQIMMDFTEAVVDLGR